MIIYRHHTGSLAESMKSARVFVSVDEMKNYIADDWAFKFQKRVFEADDIVLSDEIITDIRTGWKDTRYVCITHFGSIIYEVPQCIGMCATDFPERSKYNHDL